MNQVTWKFVEGWPYEISDVGVVRNLRGRVLKQQTSHQGYRTVILSRPLGPCRRWTAPIHKLVAITFLGPRPAGREINHRNSDKTDNRLINLEYLTRREHDAHTRAAANIKCMSDEQALYARSAFRNREKSLNQLARELGVTPQTMRLTLKGVCKAYLPGALNAEEFAKIAARNQQVRNHAGNSLLNLSDDQVKQIYARSKAGISAMALAREYGIHPRSVKKIRERTERIRALPSATSLDTTDKADWSG